MQTNAVEEGLSPLYQAGPAPITGTDSGAGNGGYAIAPQPEPVQQQEQYVQVSCLNLMKFVMISRVD